MYMYLFIYMAENVFPTRGVGKQIPTPEIAMLCQIAALTLASFINSLFCCFALGGNWWPSAI